MKVCTSESMHAHLTLVYYPDDRMDRKIASKAFYAHEGALECGEKAEAILPENVPVAFHQQKSGIQLYSHVSCSDMCKEEGKN